MPVSEIDELKKMVADLSSKLDKVASEKQPKQWPAGLKEKYTKLLSEKPSDEAN